MVCLYRTDFLTINGFDSGLDGWGGEDLRFARRVSNMKYTIIRSLDHGLCHHYHPKDCSRVGKGQRASCLRVQATSEASGQTFGLWYFKHKHNTSMWEALKDHHVIKKKEIKDKREQQKERDDRR
ncbi:Chondroitin sulfate N-acetylgalactosaminyltransferase 2 [Portunus trituberculatus]|uniref:Hexosyltransferase n=1 Tax=Portunus trituberculatus TaxID=210409 RepID=A0A5B7FJB4_PORTR|nr:Chondroitin sulfate N-acetylgalactosaminyltransferase 2 [Portunus trituberculatus]